ncbi:glycoside hydrolase family 31 protein [Listeria monocytogenes]|nr:glycoside hydrolase family 31 protein [Listeria monocytogenes]
MSKFTKLMQGYLHLIEGKNEKIKPILLETKPNFTTDSVLETASWLWLSSKINHYDREEVEPVIAFLVENWNRPEKSIWGSAENDIYLATISSVYSALLDVKNTFPKPELQQTITIIRDYCFDNLLKGDSILTGFNTRKVSTDQLLSVLPFGLFSPEDLVMVAAVGKMEQQLVQDDGVLPYSGAPRVNSFATALMALYFLEKSDQDKALHYLNMAMKMEDNDELGAIFIEINQAFRAMESEVTAHISHDPFGHENRYEQQLTERTPHYPETEMHFSAACEVISEVEPIQVELVLKEKDWTILCEKKEKNDVQIWEALVPPLEEVGEYTYYFRATMKDQTTLTSDDYTVEPIWKHWSEEAAVCETEQGLMVLFKENPSSIIPVEFTAKSDELVIGLKPSFEASNVKTKLSGQLKKDDLEIIVSNNPVRLEVHFKGKLILESHKIYPALQWYTDKTGAINKVKLHLDAPKEEEYYGFGERYNALGQRGNVLDCFVYNQYRDQGTRTYIPMPFYHTNRDYSVFVDTARYTSFDLGNQLADKHTITVEINGCDTDIYLLMGDIRSAVANYMKKTGKPAMVPVWALGPWMSSNNWDRESVVRTEVETTQELQIPSTVVVLEQWSDEATYYMFNDAEYDEKAPSEAYNYDEIRFPSWGRWPDPKGMVDYIHDNKMKLILWQIPIQKYLNRQQHPLKDREEAYMIEKGYVVKNPDGSPYRIPENWFTESLIMDFSNEEGKKWWFDKRQYLIDIGVDGFKTDGGEFVFGEGLQFADGRRGDEMRNLYPNDYVEAYYQFAQQNDGMTFSRAGYTGAQNFPAHWAGDERSTFDAFRRSLIAGLSAGFSGIPFWSFDFAGFNGDIPTAELFIRSAEMATFCPIMQYHAESKAEFNQDRTPWNIASRTGDDSVIPIYRHFANVRMNILPYIYNESLKCVETGLPMMRALLLDYKEDPRVSDMYDQYLFGEAMLIAPVIEDGVRSREVYLPEGTWYDFWNGTKVNGPTLRKCKADKEEIPVFIRGGKAVLCNVDATLKLGSWVGNTVEEYDTPLLKIYVDGDFTEEMTDHLSEKWLVKVTENADEVVVSVQTNTPAYEVEVIGTTKKVQIKKGR